MSGTKTNDPLVEAFRRAISNAGGVVQGIDADGRIRLTADGRATLVYLDNLRRRVERGEPLADAANAFARAVMRAGHEPRGEERQRGLRLQLERQDVVAGIEGLRKDISPALALCVVWTDDEEHSIRFISETTIDRWALGSAGAWSESAKQMDALLSKAPLEIEEVAGSKLGMLATHSVFKASLIAAPGLRRHVEPALGWPVQAVVPCRDFVYLFRQDDQELLGRLGAVVLREYETSPYPLSPEVLEISDSGIEALGSFGARR